MNEVLVELMRHQTWSTRQLTNSFRALGPYGLEATVPGAYGGLLATLYHAVQSEGFYCFLLAGGKPGFAWDLSKQPALDELDRRADDLEAFWRVWLKQPLDPEKIVARQNPDGTRDEARTSIVLAQVVNHGAAHREQVSAILTSLGVAPPAIDAWAYGASEGRVEMSVGSGGG